MDNRVAFNDFLKTISTNVYFQPPSNMTIAYPAIIYKRRDINKLRANNKTYRLDSSYDVTVIDKNPDSPIASKLLELDYCEFDRQFITDGLNHVSFIIYY